ncbi:MAG: AEC family transporter [Lachnospiraceae bacterium]|nr:AEC family transporter [Lachnospiraceae bacterium]
MIENITSVATQVAILFIIIGVGVILSKCKVLNKERVSGLIDIVVYIVTPSNIIVSFQREFKGELIFNLGFSFLAAFIVFFINCVMAKIVIREKNPDKNCVIRFASAFPNAGYFALPLQKAILGDIGVFYGAAYIGMFHCYIWTYGVKLLTKKPEKTVDSPVFSLVDKSQNRPLSSQVLAALKKILLNPPIIGIFIGIIFFVLKIKIPNIILSPMQSFAALNTPLPMLIIGFYLANADLKATFSNLWVYIGAFLRLIASPAIALLICMLLKVDSGVATSCIIACSAPSAALSGMLAQKFGRDTEVPAGMITFTTIVCIITMPVMVALAQYLFN